MYIFVTYIASGKNVQQAQTDQSEQLLFSALLRPSAEKEKHTGRTVEHPEVGQ